MRDVHGREVRPGDLIRVYHYRDDSTKRICYMHKLVVLVNDHLAITPDGKYLYAVDVLDIWKQGLEMAHKFRLDGEFEIIDGLSRMVDGKLQTWYERQKAREACAT